jgi:hypothetical protein
MNQPIAWVSRSSIWLTIAATVAVTAGVIGSLSDVSAELIAGTIALVVYVRFAIAAMREPLIFVVVFLLVLELFPPLYFTSSGETPIYISFFLLPIAVAIVLTRFPDIHFSWDPVAKGLMLFLVGTAFSLPFAWWLSGSAVAKESLSRWLLLIQAALVYYLIRGCARPEASRTEQRMFRILFLGAVLTAVYGVIDFVWPISLSQHPPAEQYIWLNSTVLRRAQGVFYESSNFANLCGFFLVAATTSFLARKERYLGVHRSPLALFMSVLSLAILVTFSRSTWISVIIAVLASVLISPFVRIRRGVLVFLALSIPLIMLWSYSAELWNYLVSARVGRLVDIFSDPNVATSGRVDTWIRVLSIMREHPQYLVFGIGYKTLPVTRLFHGEIITDNGYLSLLLETGISGLAGFLILSHSILKTFFKLANSVNDHLAFWSAVLFSIWCGELVQLLAADAYTYWRNIIILAALMALTVNLAERTERGHPATEMPL